MLDDSTLAIYDYLYGIFENAVNGNLYQMYEPKELLKTDTTDGFAVIRTGQINNESEFGKSAYGWVRCYVDVYVPPMSRGRLDNDLATQLEKNVIQAIDNETANPTSDTYSIRDGSMLSTESDRSDSDNEYFVFVKSFIVDINKEK